MSVVFENSVPVVKQLDRISGGSTWYIEVIPNTNAVCFKNVETGRYMRAGSESEGWVINTQGGCWAWENFVIEYVI